MAKKLKTKEYRIKYVDKILDPVHGFIDITEVEMRIIELPIFKRLQSIKQLSMTNWVFPGAEHTRYIHSLGVMYIADQMACHLGIFSDEQRQLLRLAGLLHDIGHYPLSHVTEYVYGDNLIGEDKTLFNHNKGIKGSIDTIDDKKIPEYMKSRYSIKMHHENVGTKVIKSDNDIQRIIKEKCPFIDIEDICDIIVGCVDRKPELSILVQLMHSELDADGIDYMMRDASFSGTSYGGFELGMLLRNLCVKQYQGVEIVGVKPKGISIVDQYLVSKYFAYTQVIFNKHVAIFDTMAEMLSKMLIDLDESSYPNVKYLLKNIETHCTNDKYLIFTDNFFWTQLSKMSLEALKGVTENYLTVIFDKFIHYQELEFDQEVVITSNKVEDVKKELQDSDIYMHLLDGDEKKLMLFHKRGFTSEIRERDYKELLQERWGEEYNENRFMNTNIARLQEGIAVIEDATPIRLLVDDPRSIMSYLHDTKTYILRKYIL